MSANSASSYRAVAITYVGLDLGEAIPHLNLIARRLRTLGDA